MESVSSPSGKLRARSLPAADRQKWWRRAAVLLLLTTLVVAWAVSHHLSYASLFLPVVLTIVLALGWMFHLRAGSMPGDWAFVFAVMFAGQVLWAILRLRPPGSVPLLAFGNGLFVYAMLWVFAIHEREPGLRPLATAALTLSLGIVAAPPVVIACVLLSLVFFLDQRKVFRSTTNLLLLLFTPVLLCVLTIAAVDVVTQGSVRSAGRGFWTANQTATGLGTGRELIPQQLGGFFLAFGALLSRLWERQSRACDLALIGLLGFLTTIGRAHWMPSPLSITDLSMLAYAGGACLVALNPPRTRIGRLVAFLSLAVGLWFCAFESFGSVKLLPNLNIP
jgi:hypothetical protein